MRDDNAARFSIIAAAAAQNAPAENAFDIPAQPLEAALDAFAAASRIQVLYETSLAAQRRSRNVKGLYSRDVALRLLLSDSGLDFAYTDIGAITLVPVKIPNNDARVAHERQRLLAKFDRFLGGVQAGVFAALCNHAEVRPGNFGATMRFWIASSGAIVGPALLASTGNPSRDAAITRALRRLSFSEPPPPDLPQPITMALTETVSARNEDSCATMNRDEPTPLQAARR